MPRQTNPIAQGFQNLGTILFGDPRTDALMARGANQQAQARSTEQELIQAQIAQQGRQQLGNIFGQLDPSAPDFMDTRQQAVGSGFGLGMNPETLGEAARLFTNLGGGNRDQFQQGVVDPERFLEFEQFNADAARRAQLGDIFGPEVGALLGGGSDAPDFAQRAALLSQQLNVPFPEALLAVTGQIENVTLPDGTIVQASTLNPGQLSSTLVAPEDPDRARQGLPTRGSLSGPQARADVQGRAGDLFSPQGAPQPPGQAQPQPQGATAPPAPTQPQAAGQSMPENDIQAESARRAEQAHAQGAPVTRQEGQRGAIEIVAQPSPAAEFENLEGSTIEMLRDANGGRIALFDILEYGSGLGASVQRRLSNSLGQFADDFFFEIPEIARAQIARLAAELRPLLTVSNRPSRWELTQIEQILLDPGAWRNPKTNATRLTELHADISAGIAEMNQRLAGGGLSGTDRNEMRAAVRHAKQLLEKIGTPRPVGGAQANIARLEEIGDAFLGRGGEQLRSTGRQTRGQFDRFRDDGTDDFDAQINALSAEERRQLIEMNLGDDR